MRISDWSSDVCSSDLADGCAGSLALEHARQNTDMVRPLPLRREFRRARPPLVKEGLDIRLAQRPTWRATVHDRADGGTAAFPPAVEPESAAQRIEHTFSTKMVSAPSDRKIVCEVHRVSSRIED